MIAIRVDANPTIATGHLMRCLSIARYLRTQGQPVFFICADRVPCEILEEQGFSYEVLHSDWTVLEEELPRLLPLLEEKEVSVLLVDSYYVTTEYLKTVQNHTKVVYMDDLNLCQTPISLLVNYTLEVDEREGVYPMALGSKYAPLREEFQEVAPIFIKKEMKNVMITTGGTDRNFATSHLLDGLCPLLPELQFHVVVGRFFTHGAQLKEQAERYGNVVLHENVSSMTPIIKACDVVISAGGTTLFELCACGIPTIAFEIADNQRLLMETLAKAGALCSLGKWKGAEPVRSALEEMSYEKRKDYGVNSRRLVDGQGVVRLVEQIRSL